MDNITKLAPGIYHLHLDGSFLAPEFDRYVKEAYGFTNGDFCGHPEGYRHFEPLVHRIFKTPDRKVFDAVWKDIEPHARATKFVGYIEGEFIKSDEHIPCIPFDDTVDVPFQIARRQLRGAPDELFREAELHLVMDRDKSDARLQKKLLDAGLYGAYIPDGDRVEVVFTAQGYTRDIDPLVIALRDYLHRAGGAVHGQLMKEHAIRFSTHDIDESSLPEIVDHIAYR